MNQSFEFEDRWYQTGALEALFGWLNFGWQPGKHGLILMPTGTGKSVVIAKAIWKILQTQPFRRIMSLAHDERIIKQNIEKLSLLWPTAPIGINGASFKRRDKRNSILFGMTKSVANDISNDLKNNERHFGFIDILFLDEAHLLSPKEDSQNQFIIAELQKINPMLIVVGLTATGFRMKQGKLTEGESALFTDIIYDITDTDSINRLIAEGHMAMLYAKPTAVEVDVSNVKLVAGEFNENQLSKEADKIVTSACKEMLEFGWNRNAWIVFGSSIENAEHINEELQGLGIVSTVVHSKLKDSSKRIEDFQNGYYQCIVNKDQLTTGFDYAPIDFMGDLQPTMSPGKQVQKWGRTARPSPRTNKNGSVILDFAGNVKRIGPFNDPKIPKPPGKATGDLPIKICPNCTCYNHASARNCGNCGFEFTFENKLTETASTEAIIKSAEDVIEIMTVKKVIYNLHEKKDSTGKLTSPPSIKVSYFCGSRRIDEWVMLEHPGRMGIKARQWWKERYDGGIPLTTNEALYKVSGLKSPARIKVITNRQYPEIIGAEF